MNSLNKTPEKSKSIYALEALQRKHFEILNVCHHCRREVGWHKVLNKITMKREDYNVPRLYNCEHGMKICDKCLESGSCERMIKLSKKHKKKARKRRSRYYKRLKVERDAVLQM